MRARSPHPPLRSIGLGVNKPLQLPSEHPRTRQAPAGPFMGLSVIEAEDGNAAVRLSQVTKALVERALPRAAFLRLIVGPRHLHSR